MDAPRNVLHVLQGHVSPIFGPKSGSLEMYRSLAGDMSRAVTRSWLAVAGRSWKAIPAYGGGSRPMGSHFHGCCWDTFYTFAHCGLVVEIQPLNG